MTESAFRFTHPVEVRFKDVDVGGHAHHSHALVYFEEARAAYWHRVTGREGLDGVNYILAEARQRYHARVLWPQRLGVGVRVSRLGKRHFEMEYEVRSAEGELLVSGSTTQVMYDYEAESSMPVPADTRAAIEEIDGPFGPGGLPVTNP
ncbi:acyl-CoA thioesterase [Gaopeijia maritima]|uniref:Thioesterase family protein n=1 Tax=Gaopeijia maritima TaxID=3119007 RepID=A0ABU9ED84_9BACT